MAIIFECGRYYAKVYEGVKNGKESYIYGERRKKKRDAIADEVELKKEVISKEHVVVKKESFSYVADIWNTGRKSRVSSQTWRYGEQIIRVRLKPVFGDKMIDKIKKIDVIAFIDELRVKYKPETVSKYYSILNQIFVFAIDAELIKSNPCAGVQKPAITREKKSTWTVEEINSFLSLEDVKNQTCYIAFLIIFTTGMRPGEVCGIRWCDIEDDHINPIYGITSKRELTNLKNKKAHDKVYISNNVIKELARVKSLQKELYFKNGVKFTEECFINVLLPDMRVATPDYLEQQFSRIVKRRSLKRIRLYDARHSLGTNMMKSGVNPKEVAEIMRHTSVKTTLDIYSHVDDDTKKNVAQNYADSIIGTSFVGNS